MLNASHNSQAERDYLRQRILEIFEEDENALRGNQEPGLKKSKSAENVKSPIEELESRTSLQFIDVIQDRDNIPNKVS